MTGSWWLDLLLGIAAGLLLAWAALIAALAIARPRGGMARGALRLLPDVLGLLPRLVADRSLPRGVRIRLALLLAYLAIPVDLVPDFIPAVGYADDGVPSSPRFCDRSCAARASKRSAATGAAPTTGSRPCAGSPG